MSPATTTPVRPKRLASLRRYGRIGFTIPLAFLFNTATGLLSFAAVFWLRDRFDASAAVIGWFTAVWSLTYLAGCLALRGLIGRIRPRRAMTAATAGIALFTAALPFSPGLAFAFACYGAAGFCIALFWPPLMGWLSEGHEGRRLAGITARFNISWSLANIVSPFAAGLLVEAGPEIPIAAAAVIMALITALILASLSVAPEAHGAHPVRPDAAAEPAGPAADAAQAAWLRIPAWLGLVAGYGFPGILLGVFAIYARDELGLREGAIGAIMLGRALAQTAGFPLVGRLQFWHFRLWPMPVSLLVLALMALLMASTSSPAALFLILGAIGAVMALVYNESLFHGLSGAADRAGRMAMHEAFLTAGVVAGAAAGGMLYETFSMPVLFSVYAGFLALAAAAQALMGLVMRKQAG